MGAVTYTEKREVNRGFAELVYMMHRFCAYFYKACSCYEASNTFSHKVSKNYTSPTLEPLAPVFLEFSQCRVLLQCSAIGTGITVRA